MIPDRYRFERDLILRAGAGAGKTYALVTAWLHLASGATARRKPIEPRHIVAISFTEKAAAELSDKIRGRLARLAEGDFGGEPDLLASADALGVTLPAPAHYEACLQQLGGAPVGTFHRLGGLLLRRHAVEAKIDPASRQLDETEASERLLACAERTVLDALARRAPGVEELVVELGFAGSGFAAGLVETLCRVHGRRAEEGLDAVGLDANYAPAKLREQWFASARSFVGAARALVAVPVANEKWQLAFSRMSRTLPALAGSLLDDRSFDEQTALVSAARDLYAEQKDLRRPARSDELEVARDTFKAATERLAEELVARRAAPLAAALANLLGETTRRYTAEKRRLGALDFADLIVGARDLLRDHPEVRLTAQESAQALLVDEFQDTNAVQAELVTLLAGTAATSAGGGRLFVVGDRKQSIYEFRGGNVGVFLRLEAARLAAGGATDALQTSRRSRAPLVRLTNALFARAFAPTVETSISGSGKADDFAIAWDPATDPLAPLEETDPAERCCELLETGGDDGEARLHAEARAIALRFAALQKEGWSDMALLLRGFTHVDAYLEALRHAGVPHYVVNGRGFFEAQEVRDLAAALQLLDDPEDRLSLVTVLRSPLVALSDETLLRFALAGELRLEMLLGDAGLAFACRTDDDPGERERFFRFRTLFGELRRRADRIGPTGLLRRIADDTHLEIVLAAGYQGEQRVANFLRLVERARAMEEAGADLRGFVRWLSRLTEPGGDGGDRQAAQAQIASDRKDVVRVMTIHQSKGLEFDVVAVGALGTRGKSEHAQVSYDPDAGLGLRLRDGGALVHAGGASARVAKVRAAKAQAESLRLFYVAVTRAKRKLLLAGTAANKSVTWRRLLDEARDADPEVGLRVHVVGEKEVASAALAPSTRTAPLRDDAQIEARTEATTEATTEARTEAILARLTPRPAAPRGITVAVTQLADFELCPRRHHLFHVVGLAEHPRAARAASTDGAAAADSPLDALARGTLAHHLLERADLARALSPDGPAAHLDELLTAGGYDPDAPAVAEVRDHVRRFLGTPFVHDLVRSKAKVSRELPFLLPVRTPGGLVVRLRGQIDLLTRDGGTVTVIDYKHARRGDSDDYRFQLAAYALAARRLFPEARRVSTGLAFLREADPTPVVADADAAGSDRFAEAIATLGADLARARAEERWDGRPVETCRAIGCGYLSRCHPK